MKTTLVQTITFGVDGNATEFQGAGWCLPEPGFTWIDGLRAEIHTIDLDGPLLLEIAVRPYLPTCQPYQTIYVKAGGTAVGSAIAKGWATLGFVIPRGGIVEFFTPDAIRPSEAAASHDTRALAFSFLHIKVYAIGRDAVPPVPVRQENVFASFESLGDNCEFGLAQRKSGIEPLGLLRFSGQPFQLLVDAFQERFVKLLDPTKFAVREQGGEYGVAVTHYGMWYHTFISPSDTDAETVLAQQIKRAAFLRRKLIEDIEGGEKVLVFKRNTFMHMPEILPLFAALWRIGPVNLLIARPADDGHPPGSVEVIMPGLFAGYMSEFGVYGRPAVTPEMQTVWETVCDRVMELASPVS